MNSTDREVYYVQNPAIGATILWRFICGYYAKENKGVPFPLLFIVLPIGFRADLCAVIQSTQRGKGLSKVSEKLFAAKKKDDLYTVNNTAIAMRPLTLNSLTSEYLSNKLHQNLQHHVCSNKDEVFHTKFVLHEIRF